MSEVQNSPVKPANTNAQAKESAPKVLKDPVALPSLEDLLRVGAHFGHQTSRWDPRMEQYIYATREGAHIIDIIQTLKLLKKALAEIQIASDTNSILIVGTKGQVATMVEKVAKESGAFYVNRRWPGGLFSNFDNIKKTVQQLVQKEEFIASGAIGMVKKEELILRREVEKLNVLYDGIKFMDRMPGLIIVIDSKLEKNAIKEANLVGVPIVSLLDTNCNPTLVDFPVPANDDSIKSLTLFLELFGAAIKGGKVSDRIISLRNDHQGKLERARRAYDLDVETKKQMEEEEAARMKALRSGEIKVIAGQESQSSGNVVRVVKKQESVESTVAATEQPTVKKIVEKSEVSDIKEAKKEESAGSSIESLGLNTRTSNALIGAGYKTVEQLKGLDKVALTEIKGIGDKAADDILKAIK